MQNEQSGFTLTEVLIAMTIFAVGLLAIASMQFTAIRANSLANVVSSRAALAQRVMEEILSKDSSNSFFRTNTTDTTWDLDPENSADTIVLEGSGICSATYNVTTNDPVSNVTRIIVKVTAGQRTTRLESFKRSL